MLKPDSKPCRLQELCCELASLQCEQMLLPSIPNPNPVSQTLLLADPC
jgi:hypothetical protein